jgi:hypothetical protein
MAGEIEGVKTVRAIIDIQSSDLLKVRWSGWSFYTVSKHAVEGCAEEIRDVLLELVKHCLERDVESAAPLLKKLAERGNLLYQALFTKFGDAGNDDPHQIRDQLATPGERFLLDIKVSNLILVPWGLIYPADPDLLPTSWEGIPESDRWEIYRHFWCLAHDATARYNREKDDVEDASSLAMLRVAHPGVFEKARSSIKSEPEKSFIEWLDTRYGIPLSTEPSLKQSWRENAAKIGLLYFYCHANAAKLAIGVNDSIPVHRLFVHLSNPKREGPECLLLINGCRTAVGDPRGSFLLPASSQGLCGFVGTETDVPDVFALRFSTSLLHMLFQRGKTLGEAMHCLYRDHFPLSLVYAVCAHRNFRMSQRKVPDIDYERHDNFSNGVIGTRRLEALHGD